MRIRTGALAVLAATVVRAAASVGDAGAAWPAPDRTATPKSAERRIGSASHDLRRLSLLRPLGVWLS